MPTPKWMLRHKCSLCGMGRGECHQFALLNKQCCVVCNHVDDGPWTIAEIEEMWSGQKMPPWVREHVNQLKAERDKKLQEKAGFPTPGTASPMYERYQNYFINAHCDAFAISVPKPSPEYTRTGDEKPIEESELNSTTLVRNKWVGPAPFIGDPLVDQACYFWYVWTDSEWNFVAGEASLVWRH